MDVFRVMGVNLTQAWSETQQVCPTPRTHAAAQLVQMNRLLDAISKNSSSDQASKHGLKSKATKPK